MTKQQQLTKTLIAFYQKPVAKVSAELFMSIAAVLFFAIFAIRPTLLTMSDLIKELEDKRRLEQQLSQKIAALSTAQSTYLQLESRLDVLSEAIPAQPEFIEALKLLEKVASEQELVVTNIIVNEVPTEAVANLNDPNAQTITIPVSIIITGDFINIRSFIQNVISLRRTFVVDTVVFTRTEDKGTTSLQANITFSLPYFSTGGSGGSTTSAPAAAPDSDI